MKKTYRPGAAGALLDIYEQAIAGFKKIIEDIPDSALTVIIDPHTEDDNCKSFQSILTHVVYAGFGYATFIHNRNGDTRKRRDKAFHTTVKEYIKELDELFAYTESVLSKVPEREFDPGQNPPQIHTPWNEVFDPEQLSEHAIVHVLRHGRQIERFLSNR